MSNYESEFYTVRGYELQRHEDTLTPSMEDYLEMAYRLSRDKGYTRISDLAACLNVQPPSVSKMVQKLSELDYLHYERYGLVELTDKGRRLGSYLLDRHETLERFLSIIGVTSNIIVQTEKIEHNICEETLEKITVLVEFFTSDKNILELFYRYKEKFEGNLNNYLHPHNG